MLKIYNQNILREKKGEQGQALFELVLFLPIMIIMITFFITIGNAINGSINQQKITRAYFYYYLKEHSKGVLKKDIDSMGTNAIGMMMLGWADYLQDSATPIASCYRMTSLFGDIGSPGETCLSKQDESISQYIKPKTVYGVCSANYERLGGTIRPRQLIGAGETVTLCTNE